MAETDHIYYHEMELNCESQLEETEGMPPWESRTSDLLHWLRTVPDSHEEVFYVSPPEVRNILKCPIITQYGSMKPRVACDFPSEWASLFSFQYCFQ